MQRLMEEYSVNHYYSRDPKTKCAIAERFLRTLKGRLMKYMRLKKTRKWLPAVQPIVSSYNRSKHRSTGLAPDDVTTPEMEQLARKKLFPNVSFSSSKGRQYKVGDTVRIALKHQPFDKGYDDQYTEEDYIVSRVKKTDPVTYDLALKETNQPLLGSVYGQELIPVTTP